MEMCCTVCVYLCSAVWLLSLETGMAVRLDQLGLESSGVFSKIPGTWAGRTQRVGAAGMITCRPYAWSYRVAWVLRGAPSKEHSHKRTRWTFPGPAVEVTKHPFCLILFIIHESRRRPRSREGNAIHLLMREWQGRV